MRKPPEYAPGKSITMADVQDVLSDDGYSAGERKTWLKSVLTDVTQQQSDAPSADRDELIEAIQAILDSQQDGEAKAKDVL